jgi:hypothetical protein
MKDFSDENGINSLILEINNCTKLFRGLKRIQKYGRQKR